MLEYVVVDNPDGPRDELFHDAFGDAVDELLQRGIDLALTDRREEATLIRVQWADIQKQAAVRVCDDYVADVRFLELEARDESTFHLLQQVVAKYLKLQSWRDLVGILEAEAHDVLAIRRLGLAAPCKWNERVFQVLQRALTDKDPSVRDAAVMAAGATGWHEWAPLLRKLFETLRPGSAKARVAEAIRLVESRA